MSRLLLSFMVTGLLAQSVFAFGQTPNVVTREITVTATVDRIERSTRVVTLRGDDNSIQTVYVDPKLTAFDKLQVGDVVTVRYVESAIIQVRPNARATGVRDTTEEARKVGGDKVIAQTKAVVTIENVDLQAGIVSYRTDDGVRAMRGVTDKRVLQGLKPGERVEITLTRERAVDIQHKRR